MPGWSAQLRERRARERKTVGFPFTKKQKDQRTGLFVFVWVSGTISCMYTQLSPVRPVRRGVLDSCALLWLLVYPRSRTSSPYRQAAGAEGSWLHWGVVDAWREDPLIRGTIIGEQGGREARKGMFVLYVFDSICFGLVRLFLPTWATGGVKDLAVLCASLLCVYCPGPWSVGVGFTNLGKSHHRTPGFQIGKFQILRKGIDCFMNTKFDR